MVRGTPTCIWWAKHKNWDLSIKIFIRSCRKRKMTKQSNQRHGSHNELKEKEDKMAQLPSGNNIVGHHPSGVRI